jgi:hypothetical protein
MRRSYTIFFPHFYNVKNALTYQNNAIEVSAIGRIIGSKREKASKNNTYFEKNRHKFCIKF